MSDTPSAPNPRHGYAVAVVGDRDVMPAEDLTRLLDLMVNRCVVPK